jgi:hypothetical protein
MPGLPVNGILIILGVCAFVVIVSGSSYLRQRRGS